MTEIEVIRICLEHWASFYYTYMPGSRRLAGSESRGKGLGLCVLKSSLGVSEARHWPGGCSYGWVIGMPNNAGTNQNLGPRPRAEA